MRKIVCMHLSLQLQKAQWLAKQALQMAEQQAGLAGEGGWAGMTGFQPAAGPQQDQQTLKWWYFFSL